MIAWLQPRAERYRFLPQQRLGGGPLPWVIGLMTFLAALAIAGGIALTAATANLSRSIERGFTVQVVEPNPAVKSRQAQAIVAMLKTRRDITGVHMLGHDEIKVLLEPWLGTGNVGDDLPLPVMIDAAFVAGANGGSAAIEAEVRQIAPTARVDDHAQWFAPLTDIVDVLKWLALAIAALVAAATTAIVTLSVRAAISTHTPTIETLHMIGAEDRTITALFEYRYALDGLAGGIAGVAGSVVIIAVVGNILSSFGDGLLGSLSLPPLGWAALVALPFVMLALSMLTARVTVGRALGVQL